MKKKRLNARWRRETAFYFSLISAALNARAKWDHANAALWQRCTDLLATASLTLQQGRQPPPEWRSQFDRLMIQLRTELNDDLD